MVRLPIIQQSAVVAIAVGAVVAVPVVAVVVPVVAASVFIKRWVVRYERSQLVARDIIMVAHVTVVTDAAVTMVSTQHVVTFTADGVT